MIDNLALYSLSQPLFDGLGDEDIVGDKELAQFIERRGKFIADIYFDRVSIKDVCGGVATAMGGSVDGLIGRAGLGLEPSGPVSFTSHIPPDALTLISKTLSQAQGALRDSGHPANAALVALNTDVGGQLSNVLRRLERFLGDGRGKPGALIALYTKWGA